MLGPNVLRWDSKFGFVDCYNKQVLPYWEAEPNYAKASMGLPQKVSKLRAPEQK